MSVAKDIEFEVAAVDEVAHDIYRMLVACETTPELSAGQFVNLSVPGAGQHLLRIPLSFSRVEGRELEMVFSVVGEGTRRLSQMRVGDVSRMTAPLGRGFWLPERPERALLVAGGIGLPPMVAAAGMLAEAGIAYDAIVGARSERELAWPLVDELRQGVPDRCEGPICHANVYVATDDGSAGVRAFTTQVMEDLLAEHRYSTVYACGPEPMLAGVARLAKGCGMSCQVSLERMMGCGFGACSCCNVALARGGYALCCTDGPVFDAREVAW